MKKLKHWIYEKLLPAWCREELLTENARLRQKLFEAQQQIERQRAYIDGMTAALRQQRRITVKNEVKQ